MNLRYVLVMLAILPIFASAQQQERQNFTTQLARARHVPFSGAVRVGNTLYIAGTTAPDLATRGAVTVGDEAHLVMDEVKRLVEQAGFKMDDLVSVQVFATRSPGCSNRLALAQSEHTEGEQGQHVHQQEHGGKGSVTARDEGHQAEALGDEHARHENRERDREARPSRQRRPAPPSPGGSDALVDRVHGPRTALEQRREDHQLEEQPEQGQIEALQEEVRR